MAMILMFVAGAAPSGMQGVVAAMLLSLAIVFGVFLTLAVSRILSGTLLKGMPSGFVLELPPYRKPQMGRVLVRSFMDRSVFVLGRAVIVAAPAGLLIWCMANVYLSGGSLLSHCAGFLDPFARLMGLDGVILLAFVLGFPANEIVVPVIIMAYLNQGGILELNGLDELKALLVENGWTMRTAVCMSLFILVHWPCGTTCLTIKKETGSRKWTFAAIAIPTGLGIVLCMLVAWIWGTLAGFVS